MPVFISQSYSIARQRHIPTIIGLFLLVLGIGFGVYLVQSRQSPNVSARPQSQPNQVEISNITSNSFVVSWTTQEKSTGMIAYGEDSEVPFLARDKRDIFDQKLGQYVTHWVQIVGLNASKQYYFVIKSSGQDYDNQGTLYTVTTAPDTSLTEGITAYGTINKSGGQPAEGVIVLLDGEDIAPQSALTDAQGKWSINLAAARNKSLQKIATVKPESSLELRAQGGLLGNSTARLSASQISPATTIELGKTYDLSTLAPLPTDAAGEPKSKFDFVNELSAQSNGGSQAITIWNPQENETISTDRPLFIGTGPISQTISLSIDIPPNQITGTTETDERGNWQWTAPSQLSSGNHKLTVSNRNTKGVTIQSERQFTVLAGSTSPSFESSPSASQTTPTPTPKVSSTLTPTIKVTATPTPTTKPTSTPTKSLSLTPTPASEISLTPTPTTKPTSTPTTTQVSETTPSPTTTVTLPVAGVTAPTTLLTALGVILIAGALALLI